MSQPPELLPFAGDWSSYEDQVYQVFLDSFVMARVMFQGLPVKAKYRQETHGKGYSFWHTISEAPDPKNRNEEDRIPDLRRCERIRWIAWVIDNAENDGFVWWENRRKGEAHVVIWNREHDFAVVLAKRSGYYLLKTAYSDIRSHTKRKFEAEIAEWEKSIND